MICLVLTIFANLFPSGERPRRVGRGGAGQAGAARWAMPEAGTPAAYSGVNERTFLAVKPDGVQRRLVGEIVRRFERKGFKLVALKLVQVWAHKGAGGSGEGMDGLGLGPWYRSIFLPLGLRRATAGALCRAARETLLQPTS